MEENNSRPAQAESSLDTNDWRDKLSDGYRQQILNKLMEIIKNRVPASCQENLIDIRSAAMACEERIYNTSANENVYIQRISQKMILLGSKSQPNVGTISLPSNSTGGNQSPSDPALHGVQSQVRNQGQSLAVPSANHSQPQQQHLAQNLQSSVASAVVETSANFPPAQPCVIRLSQSGQSSNLQNMPGISQDAVCSLVEQGVQSNMFANLQREMREQQYLQQVVPQHHKHQLIVNQQMKQQFLMQNLQPGNIQPLQSHNQQQSNQMKPSQLSLMQMSSGLQSCQPNFQQTQLPIMQSAPESSLQLPSVQQSAPSVPHPQSALRQHQQSQQPFLHQHASALHQKQLPISWQPMLSSQKQLQLMGQHPSLTNFQKNQLLRQNDSAPDMQQQHQRLLSQQSNLLSMQQLQPQPQPQLLSQQNISSLHDHQKQLGLQSCVSGLQKLQQHQQQQQLIGSQLSVSNMLQQDSLQMSVAAHLQQTQQTSSALFPSQGQHSQSRPSQQHLRSELQPQPTQLQEQPNSLQRVMQKSQISDDLLQPQNAIEQQKQLVQLQRGFPETSSTSIDSTICIGGVDWQEKVYQKLTTMKELYSPELNEVYRMVTLKLQQHDALEQSPKRSDQIEKLRRVKSILEKLITFLQLHKSDIVPRYKEIPMYEKQIVNFIRTNRFNKLVSRQQGQFQLSDDHSHSMPQQPESQFPQLQQHGSYAKHVKQMQPENLQGSVTSMPTASVTSMQHGSMTLPTRLESALGNVMNSLQNGEMSSLQQSTTGSLQHNIINASHKTTINTLNQSNLKSLQPNNPLPVYSNILQDQHLNQQKLEQQLKFQYQQCYLHPQKMQQQPQQQAQLQQKFQQQQKPQQSPQLETLHMPQNEVNELAMRQGTCFKTVLFQQHQPPGQRPTYFQQQLNTGPCLVSSPQILASSSQISQHSSPQVDQQSLPPSLSKSGMPLQSANSPFVAPSPLTPSLAPSPMTGNPEKQSSAISSISNAGNIGPQNTALRLTQAQSPAIATPGISTSPLLAEFTSLDGNQNNAPTILSSKSSPLERLIKVVRSITPKAFSSSMSDISSVVSMVDRIAGSTHGNDSRCAVGEDLVAMTKCRSQARRFMLQDSIASTKKMKRHTSSMPSNVVLSAGSVDDRLKQLISPEISELESTATSRIKRRRVENDHALLKEINLINQCLIETVVELSDEDVDSITVAAEGKGTVVKCSFTAVALSPYLKSQYDLGHMSPILPLWLLVPANYPNCSPVLLEKSTVQLRKESEDLSSKAKLMFGVSIRGLSQYMSLGEMAKTWDSCARKVVTEYAQRKGGGTFSSRYGTWESCLNA